MKLHNIDSIKGLVPYAQYSQVAGIPEFFSVLKQVMYDQLKEKLSLLDQISWQYNGDNTYLSFFYKNVYGFEQGFGEPLIKNLYDEGKQYDTGLKYDDSDFDGKLPLPLYKILIQYLMDYSEETFQIGWLTSFIQDFCLVDALGYTIEFKADGVKVIIPRSTRSILLRRIFLDNEIFNMTPIERVYFELTD